MRRAGRWVRGAVLGCLWVIGMATTGGGAEPYPLDLAFTRRTIPDYEKATVSPDGRFLACNVSTPVRHRDEWWTLPSGFPMPLLGGRVHVVEVATGRDRAVGADGSNSFGPVWSPDGGLLAYYSDEGGVLRAWLFDPASGVSRRASDVRVKVHLYSAVLMPPSWSPDGATLLIPALPVSEVGADPREDSSAPPSTTAGGAAGPRVRVLTTGDEPAVPPAPPNERVASPYRTAVDVTAVDVRTGAARVVLPADPLGRIGPASARFSPSGRFLVTLSGMRPTATATEPKDSVTLGIVRVGEVEPVFTEVVGSIYEGHESYSGDGLGRTGVIQAWHPTRDVLVFLNEYQLRRVDLTGLGAPAVATLAPNLGRLNGDYLAFAGHRDEVLVGLFPADANKDSPRASALGLAPLAGGPGRRLDLPGHSNRGRVVRRGRVALWEPVPDSATLLCTGGDGTSTVCRRLDLASGAWTDVRTVPMTVEFQAMPRDGSFLVAKVESYTRAPDLYRLGPDLAVGPRLGVVDSRVDEHAFGAVESFETVVPLHDGRLKTVRTAVLLPPGAKRGDRLPAILTLYGGSSLAPQAREYGGGLVATIPTPVFTSRGYALILADAPLGPEIEPGNPAEQLRDVILPQVYHAAELGYVDIERVAVTGQSYGGYSTAALATTTNLFRAAIPVSGIYDLAGDYGVLATDDNQFHQEWSERGQGRMGSPPWADLRRYLDNSPYYRADRVRTPLLIIHGRLDRGCPVRGAEGMFAALRRLGRTAQLAVYEGEGHVIYEWDLANATDAATRMLDFLDRHLKPPVKVSGSGSFRRRLDPEADAGGLGDGGRGVGRPGPGPAGPVLPVGQDDDLAQGDVMAAHPRVDRLERRPPVGRLVDGQAVDQVPGSDHTPAGADPLLVDAQEVPARLDRDGFVMGGLIPQASQAGGQAEPIPPAGREVDLP